MISIQKPLIDQRFIFFNGNNIFIDMGYMDSTAPQPFFWYYLNKYKN